MKKVLLVLFFVVALYVTSFLFSELSPKDWYGFPTLFTSLLVNAVSFYLVGKEFVK